MARVVYYLFCDESYLPPHSFMIQGAVSVAEPYLPMVRDAVCALRERHKRLEELKWEYVTGSKPLVAYQELVDLYMYDRCSLGMGFACMVSAKVDDPNTHADKVGKDLGFWKAYYTFIANRLTPGCSYHIRLHQKQGPRPNAIPEFERYLKYFAASLRPRCHILSCEAAPAKKYSLIQLADVFSGAVGWEWNDKPGSARAKHMLHARICGALGRKKLTWQPLKTETRFNIWRWKPQEPEQLALQVSGR